MECVKLTLLILNLPPNFIKVTKVDIIEYNHHYPVLRAFESKRRALIETNVEYGKEILIFHGTTAVEGILETG